MMAPDSLAVLPGRPSFDDLYREFLPRIGGYVRRLVADREDAEDVTAEAFARAFEAYPRFEPRGSSPACWLFRIARNASFDHRRKTLLRSSAEAAAAGLCQDLEDPCQVAERRVWNRQFRIAIAGLPERQREIVSLRHAGGLSFKEAGERLGCSEDAAKMRYQRALRALRPAVSSELAA